MEDKFYCWNLYKKSLKFEINDTVDEENKNPISGKLKQKFDNLNIKFKGVIDPNLIEQKITPINEEEEKENKEVKKYQENKFEEKKQLQNEKQINEYNDDYGNNYVLKRKTKFYLCNGKKLNEIENEIEKN